MATFHIHQDTEKENATLGPNGNGKNAKPSVLQPIAVSNASSKLDATKQRSTFSILNNNTARGAGIGATSKTNFHDVQTSKNDENAGISNQQIKKSSILAVDQLKTFSVYEDKSFQFNSTENNENINFNAVNDVEEKENRNDHSITKHNSVLNGTPMSVTDVLSPMSIDRSINVSQFDDISHRNLISATPLPRNDRERFFEVLEYQESILEYFRTSEKEHRPKAGYMKRQPDINYSMRTILVDWLVEVAEEYNLDTETLYLTVSYIDRFLSHMSVVRAKLQLVGTAAMYIASKYEEIYPPDVSEFVFITDDTYTKAQVLRMEQIILKILEFDLCVPTSYAFINTYSVLFDLPERVKYLAQYLSELSLLEGDPFLKFYPSVISSASLALAQYTLSLPIWSSELENVSSYRIEDIKEVFLCLSQIHINASDLTQQAIQEKYKSSKYNEVSTIKPVNINEQLFDSIVREYYQIKEMTTSKLQFSATTGSADGSKTNDSVRKMISSLMYS